MRTDEKTFFNRNSSLPMMLFILRIANGLGAGVKDSL
jgi:hypothetical protein